MCNQCNNTRYGTIYRKPDKFSSFDNINHPTASGTTRNKCRNEARNQRKGIYTTAKVALNAVEQCISKIGGSTIRNEN